MRERVRSGFTGDTRRVSNLAVSGHWNWSFSKGDALAVTFFGMIIFSPLLAGLSPTDWAFGVYMFLSVVSDSIVIQVIAIYYICRLVYYIALSRSNYLRQRTLRKLLNKRNKLCPYCGSIKRRNIHESIL
jgi:hypothetical protein